MTPGTPTGPGEQKEHLDRRSDETSDHGQQVRYTRDFCEQLRKEPRGLKSSVEAFLQKTKSKDQLKKEFRDKLKSWPKEERERMGLVSAGADPTDGEVDTFLSNTKCFENQFLAQIETDIRAKNKAHEDMITNCLETAHEEYGDFDEQALKKALSKEDAGRLRTFLEIPKFRRTYIKKLPGSQALRTRDFSDINFDEITKSIAKLDATHPKRREIQEAWLKIAQVAHPEKNLAQAFSSITEEGGPKVDIAGAYSAFFGADNTLVSPQNRNKILNFLTRQYIPLVPFSVLEAVDPKTSKTFLTSDVETTERDKDLPADAELAKALKRDKEVEARKIYRDYIGGGKNVIGTQKLPLETKIRLLSQFGSAGKAEKFLEYYRGNPSTLRNTTDTEEVFRDKFKATYDGLDPEKLDTKNNLTEELLARLGNKIDGIENFEPGCAMQWTTKDPETKEDITGYYIIDTVPTEDPDEENILTVRFLGDNKGPLAAAGLAHHYTGADFYHYLDGCAEDGKITFRNRSEFDREMETNTAEKKLPRYHTQEETSAELQNQFSETNEIQSLAALDHEIDQILNPHNNHAKESKSPEDRKLYEGMIFTKISDGSIDTFQIQEIDEDNGRITLWDGWGSKQKSEKNKSVQEMSFAEFSMTIQSLKKTSKDIYRLPIGAKKKFGIEEFNQFCILDSQYEDGKDGGLWKKMRQAHIREIDGKHTFGKIDPKTGSFAAMPVIKIGEKKDLYIESISDGTVTYRKGTFKQGKYDKEKDVWTQKTEFSGSPISTMSLAMLWGYLYENKFEFDQPIKEEKKKEPKNDKKMSWWNVLMHSHSLGVILHGDLWKAPFKAWEEQHHKDHAFAGKLTAALAIDKLKAGGYGPISGILGWAEWPSLMVADGSSSIQSYLNELVEKIDGMSSTHRTNLIKKWSKKEHFPSPKFMAAMFASMQIFGQLYPYDNGGDDYKDPHTGSHEWFWYNSICHSLDPNHQKYPHMPPHEGEPWPNSEWVRDTEGNTMTEVQACHKLFGSFKHPLLTNLGRRFQKYSSAGQDKLKSGGPGNLNERLTMDGKLDWMMNTVLGQKIPEAFGDVTELWLKEGYPAQISTMPYAAALFGCREQQMLPQTQEHIKKQFQEEGVQIPMFVFMQSKNLGDVFRDTSIAFAYTISETCGDTLQKLVATSSKGRLAGEDGKKWAKSFSTFWRQHGTQLMHKLSGMRDPMLNLMTNDPQTFDEMLEDQPEAKKKEYKRLRENKGVIGAYYNRLRETYDSPSHVALHRDKGFYSGDHFRFRDSFEVGYPMAWINWDAYIDANLDKNYARGEASTDGDGVFNEIRGFLYKIPKMAEKMAIDMGFTSEPKKQKYKDKISKTLYEKTVAHDKIGRLMKQKIDAKNPKAEYCSMTAMMFEIIPPQQLAVAGAPEKEQKRYEKYFEQIKASLAKAKEIELRDGFAKGIEYREKMATRWSEIVKNEINTGTISLEQIHSGDFHEDGVSGIQKNTQSLSGNLLAQKLKKFDAITQGKNTQPSRGNHTQEESEQLNLAA